MFTEEMKKRRVFLFLDFIFDFCHKEDTKMRRHALYLGSTFTSSVHKGDTMRRFAFPCLLAAMFVVTLGNSARAGYIWTAFNDFAGNLSTGNVSNISGPIQGMAPRTGATVPVGTLVKYADGSSTGVTLTIGGTVDSWLNNTFDTNPTGGDALTYFPEAYTINTDGTTSGSAKNQYITLALTGLNASGVYNLTLFSNRGSATGQTRLQDFVISDVQSFTNSSSIGSTISTVSMANDKTTIQAIDNTSVGRVARYTNIVAGSDGDLAMTLTCSISDDYMHLNAMRLDLVSIPEPSAFVLVGTGLLGLLAYAWRKRK